MAKVVRIIAGIGMAIAGAVTGNFKLVLAGISLAGGALLEQRPSRRRDAIAATLQTGEVPRQAVFGRSAVAGSLVDAFNYGGKHGTDWEVLVIALADHRCDALEGFFVDDAFHSFTGDGAVPGFNGQLEVYFRDGRWDQEVPSILTTHGPGWTANDRGRGVAYAVVAYKADDEKAKNPVWEGRRPSFLFVLRGLRAYQARKDSSVGGSGAHRWDDPATREWTENPIDIRHTWVRGIYAGDRVDQPEMLLIGRGLSAIEAPPQNVFARANLCDEIVDGSPRYRIGGVVSADEPYIEVESDIAAACGGVISQPEGAVEVNPGEARAPIAHFTDKDLIVGSRVTWSEFLGISDEGWVNTVIARFVDPAQRWKTRAAPVRRETADIIADGGPREQTLALSLVTHVRQAERVAEIARRFGRLWARGTVTLPPRFAGVEEGDWVTWKSDRYFGGATRTFRVEAWGSDQGWRHQLTLRQISASVFSEADPLDDGVIAAQQPAPAARQPPLMGAWALSATQIAAGSVQVPALQIIGETDDPSAQFVIFEFVQQTAAPDENTQWTLSAVARPDITRLSVPVPSGGTHYMAVSYVVDRVTGPRRVLGPVTLGEFAYPDGVAFSDLRPAEPGSTRNQDGGGNLLSAPITLEDAIYTPGANPALVSGQPAAQLSGADFGTVFFGDFFPVRGGERLYFSYVAHADVANLDSIRGGFIWRDADGVETSSDLPGTALAGTAAVGFENSVVRTEGVVLPAAAVAARFYVVRPAFASASGGSFFVRRPFVGRSEPGATFGAPAGSLVAGVDALFLTNQAASAQSSAFAANAAIAIIADDSFLSLDEKPEIRKQRDIIIGEYMIIRAQGISAGISIAAYEAAYNALIAYLGGLDLDGATNTAIVRATFNAAFTSYFAARQTVLDGVAARGIGSFKAKHNLLFNGRFRLGLNGWQNVAGTWRFVRDAQGQFVEQPLGTGGTFVLRSTVPIFVGPGGQLVISLQAFALAAGSTEVTFADIEWRNGGNDTLLGFSSDISGNGAIIAANAPANAPVYVSQAVVAPNPTDASGFIRGFVRIVSIGTLAYEQGGHAALGVKVEAGTTPSAISDEATDGAVLDNTFGRIRDPEAYPTQTILGPKNITDLVPSYTVGASNVTITLPAHSRTIATRTGPRTLSYGGASGVIGFSTAWWAYTDDPELTGAVSPTVTFTTNPNDLLFAGRYQIAAGFTPDSGGGGGNANPGGGMFPVFEP
ncbi:MAG: phage tail protein [Erythrobacter sp.]